MAAMSASPQKDSAEVAGTATSVTTPESKEDGSDQVIEGLVKLCIVLPHDASTIYLEESTHAQVQDIRQSIIDFPPAYRYTCFHLEHNGNRVNDFVSLSEISNLGHEAEIRLIEDPYTEKDARLHLVRVRELIGAAGDRTDAIHGVLNGSSLHDDVALETFDVANSADIVKDYDFTTLTSWSTLLPKAAGPAPKTVKGISLSPWNPPPSHLKQKGHLLYLVVTTNEGEQFHITGHVSGFYLNKSSNSKFDPFPRPAPKGQSSHSLLTLIDSVSPSFSVAFKELQEYNSRRDPLSTFQVTNWIPSSPWIVPPPTSPACAHSPDLTRSQETYLLAGADNSDTLRDWNEEVQTAKELPRETVQDRLFRERLISKLYADYVDAATRGAVMVARGEVSPLNPTECVDAQIFVYNNVFFSFGADGVGTFTSEGGDEAARIATGKDVAGVRIINQLDIDGLYTPGTVVVDYLGKRIVAQSIVPGIFKQRDPGENQIDYGAVDGKDTVASDERFVSVFGQMSRALKVKKHPVWDKDGKRIELEASVETKGLMGTDGRKYVLDLYRITPLDILWVEDGESGAEKGLAAYPHRMTVLRPELVESFVRYRLRESLKESMQTDEPENTISESVDNTLKPGNEDEAAANDHTEEGSKKSVEETIPTANGGIEASEQETAFAAPESALANGTNGIDVQIMSLNPDVFTGQAPQTDSEIEEWQSDEQDVRQAGNYLRDQVIPELLHDLGESDISFPMDGSSLGRVLHKRGINIRYIGKIASMCEGPRLACMLHVCVQDMIARAFKHIASKHLRTLPLALTNSCASHLLNCLLGLEFNPKPTAEVDPSLRRLYGDVDLSFEKVSPENIQIAVREQVAKRFRYDLAHDCLSALANKQQLLRQVSLYLGFQLQARDYTFAAPDAVAQPVNGVANSDLKKKKKKGGDSSPVSTSPVLPPTTFHPDDIVNIVPVVRHSCPRSSLAEEALEAGRLSLAQGQRVVGQELLLESLSIHEQIYGILHPEVARAYNSLSMLYYHMDEKPLYYHLDDKPVAVELARKAAIVSERTVGVDSAETLLNYLNLSLFLHKHGDSKSALVFSKHALNLWKVIYGPNHPDSITTINNAAVMLQHLQCYRESRLWFEESLRVCEIVYGKQSINVATLLFQLAQALALDHDSKGAVRRMKESYTIFLAELGADDKNTQEAESLLEQLTQSAVSIAKQAKDLQARRIRPGIRFASRGAPFEASSGSKMASSAVGPTPAPASQIDPRSIDELIKFIEGTDVQPKTAKRRPSRGNPKMRGKA